MISLFLSCSSCPPPHPNIILPSLSPSPVLYHPWYPVTSAVPTNPLIHHQLLEWEFGSERQMVSYSLGKQWVPLCSFPRGRRTALRLLDRQDCQGTWRSSRILCPEQVRRVWRGGMVSLQTVEGFYCPPFLNLWNQLHRMIKETVTARSGFKFCICSSSRGPGQLVHPSDPLGSHK